MKAKIQKIVFPIFLSVLCGFICGRLVYSIYDDKESKILSSNIIYLLEDGSFEDYDTMKASSISTNYVFYEDDGKYNTVVAMTKNKDNISKIEKAYNKELKVTEYLLDNKEISNKIEEYDNILVNTEDAEEIKKIVIKMIEIYKDKEDTKMSKIM